ncbi:MAG: stressosome-associated protein Prli42 [Clostridia bacterium]|nr:stressosome-associated protein Prli42 [Clostridia bacterium]
MMNKKVVKIVAIVIIAAMVLTTLAFALMLDV